VKKSAACIDDENLVVQFYLQDDNSKVCPGKDDYKTMNGVQYQKRIMMKLIDNLFELFVSSAAVSII
jgi:hypothetical protein